MKSIRQQKRALDLNEKVSALKIAENDFQDLLDEISLLIGKTVSEAVKFLLVIHSLHLVHLAEVDAARAVHALAQRKSDVYITYLF